MVFVCRIDVGPPGDGRGGDDGVAGAVRAGGVGAVDAAGLLEVRVVVPEGGGDPPLAGRAPVEDVVAVIDADVVRLPVVRTAGPVVAVDAAAQKLAIAGDLLAGDLTNGARLEPDAEEIVVAKRLRQQARVRNVGRIRERDGRERVDVFRRARLSG